MLRHIILHFDTDLDELKASWKDDWLANPAPNVAFPSNFNPVRTVAPAIHLDELYATETLGISLDQLHSNLSELASQKGISEVPVADENLQQGGGKKAWRWAVDYKGGIPVVWPEGVDLRVAIGKEGNGVSGGIGWGEFVADWLTVDCSIGPKALAPLRQFFPSYVDYFGGPLDTIFVYLMFLYFWAGKNPAPHDNTLPSESLGKLVVDGWAWESDYTLNNVVPVTASAGESDDYNLPWKKANNIPAELGGSVTKRLAHLWLTLWDKTGVDANNGGARISWFYGEHPSQQGMSDFQFYYSPPLFLDGWPNSLVSPFSWPTTVGRGPGIGYCDPNYVSGDDLAENFAPKPDDGGIVAGNCVEECDDGPECNCAIDPCTRLCLAMYILPFEIPQKGGSGTACQEKGVVLEGW